MRRIDRFPLALLLGLLAVSPAAAKDWGTSWFPIGPAPSCCFFPGGESGRATTVAINPANGFDVWLGTAGGGVWHTTNADRDPGATWTWYPMSDQEESLAIGALALADCDAGECSRIYVGTGENAIRRDTYSGQGLLFGTYSGCAGCAGIVSWTRHDKGTSQDGTTLWDFRRASINDIVLDRTTTGPNPETQRLYLTLSSGVTASASEATVTAPEPLQGSASAGYGIYRSTNNGTNWDYLPVPGAEGAKPTDLEIDPDPAHPLTLYAAFEGRGIFKTENGGTTWCPLNPGIPRPGWCPVGDGLHLPDPSTGFDHVELAIADDPAQRLHLYASFGLCPQRLTDECTPSIYETFDGGAYWYLRFQGSPLRSFPRDACPAVYSRYTHGLTIVPGHPERLFLAGVHLCVSGNRGAEPWLLADDSIQPKTQWDMIHLDHHEVVFDSVGAHALAVSDGGIYSSTNQGFSWTSRNDGLQTILFQSIATSSRTQRIFGGTQDNSAMLWTGAKAWQNQPGFGDAGYAVLDEDNPGTMYSTTNSATSGVIVERSINGAAFADIPGTPSNLEMLSDPSSIYYPPLVQSPTPTPNQAPAQHALYYGTNRLWRSDDDASSWTDVSPVLCDGPSQPELGSGVDVVSAIAVAPSDPKRIYVGCYSGKVFATDDACDQSSCWYAFALGLPGTPVTWLAVDPLDRDVVYATVSGFAPGSHVYGKTPSLFHWVKAGSIAAFNGVPANTIAIESHGPSEPRVLWLGTDRGVYRSPNGGSSWSRYGTGLPNVPVYQISIDETHRRIVAGTHGRGAYLLTGPTLSNFNDCEVIYGHDLPVYGAGFAANVACSMRVVREHGSVCGNSPFTKDADGGDLRTNGAGELVTSKGAIYAGKPVALACHAGKCAGNVSLSACNLQTDRIAAVEVTCGSQVAFDQIPGCPALINPPSSWTTLTGLESPFEGLSLEASPRPGSSPGTVPEEAVSGGASFDFVAAIQSGDGTSRVLCTVSVPYVATDTPSVVLQNARDAVNGSAACQTAGVGARFTPAASVEGEDPYGQPGTLSLVAPGLAGGQLIGGIDAPPGQAGGLCFGLENLGLPLSNQARAMRVRLKAPGGAQGGSITLEEISSLGDCEMTVGTSSGQSSSAIASALAAAFQAPEIPLGSASCPPGHNPRDVRQDGDSLVLGLASGITLCLDDAGVGVTVTPVDVCRTDADCGDGNPCTHDTCLAANGQCQHTSEPNGLPCDDQNACTVGNACLAGTCGTPLACGDADPCSSDTCDPATGACLHAPVQCTDGNPCTADSCAAATGACLFVPLPGQRCDDGDLCTADDSCVQPAGASGPICQGTPACQDADPCTDDACNPATGACSHAALQCDDGNPCTFDFCDPTGACASVTGGPGRGLPGGGGPCDDGNPCTVGDSCVPDAGGQAVCVGEALACDDKNGCTLDSCDPATGACAHRAPVLEDARGLRFATKTQMSWQPAPGAVSWNTYRGTLPLAAASPYDQTCFEQGDAHQDGALVSNDPQSPAAGAGFYYLVSEVASCGEGPIGRDVNETAIPNASPCLVP